MSNIPIYSIAAYSGTGKTTFLEKLIPELKTRGLHLAVMKHDGHDDFAIDQEGKDTWRFSHAGADVTLIVSATKAAIIENRPVAQDQLLSQIHDVDLILLEGFKDGPWPKIALFRGKDCGAPSLNVPPGGFFAVVSDRPLDLGCPCFDLDNAAGLAEFIVCDILEKRKGKME